MRGADEYEIVPRSEIEELRKEIDTIKKNPVQDYKSSLTLIEALDKLATQVGHLLELFERANQEMYADYAKGIHEESEKLTHIMRQNERIAQQLQQLQGSPVPTEPSTPVREPLHITRHKHDAPTPAPQDEVSVQESAPIKQQEAPSSQPVQAPVQPSPSPSVSSQPVQGQKSVAPDEELPAALSPRESLYSEQPRSVDDTSDPTASLPRSRKSLLRAFR